MKLMKIYRLSVVIFSFVFPFYTFAHTHLIESNPKENAVVYEAPSKVILHFSEDLETAMCKVEVKNLSTNEIVSEGKVTEVENDKKSLQVSLKTLKNEKTKFEVFWKVVSKDTHRMQGNYQFTFDIKAK